MSKVLVTGGSGFVAIHVILKLLAAGYHVRTTVRDPSREADVRAMVKQAGMADPGGFLSFAVAELDSDDGWPQAVAACDYVHHVASPFPPAAPKHEDDLIIPARDGALRVLRAARDAGVKRVILTSSFAAIGYGQPGHRATFDETNWTDPAGPGVEAYIKSKTLAERAAWDFIAREGGGLELAVVNPVAVFGPALGPKLSSSVLLVKALLDGAMPAVPDISFGVIDVRDVADLHMLAMLRPEAAGERFLAVAGDASSLHDIALILHRRLGPAAANVPRFRLPSAIIRVMALWNGQARSALPHLGVVRRPSADKAKRLLGWSPRPVEEAVVATAESLIALDLLRTRA